MSKPRRIKLTAIELKMIAAAIEDLVTRWHEYNVTDSKPEARVTEMLREHYISLADRLRKEIIK